MIDNVSFVWCHDECLYEKGCFGFAYDDLFVEDNSAICYHYVIPELTRDLDTDGPSDEWTRVTTLYLFFCF